jgi:hypothetical protein
LSLVVGLFLYALAAMWIGAVLVPAHWAAHAAFYAITGIAWIWPAARLTKWMTTR